MVVIIALVVVNWLHATTTLGGYGPANVQARRAALATLTVGIIPPVPVHAEAVTGIPTPVTDLLATTQGELRQMTTNTTVPELSGLFANSGTSNLLIGVGVFLLVLVPLFKIVAAGAIGLFVAGEFDDKVGEDDQDIVKKIIQRLSGEPPDGLDNRQLKVARLNDELVAMKAAILERLKGQAAGEAMRKRAASARFRIAWNHIFSTMGLKPDVQAKVDAVVEKFQKSERERRAEHRQIHSAWIHSVSRNEFHVSWWHHWRLRSSTSRSLELQDKLISELRAALPKPALRRLRELLVRRADPGWLGDGTATAEPHVYVIGFDGDTGASQTALLAKEVSAILSMPVRPQEVVLLLRSPGGAVTGYGLAAAELMRLRQHGVRLVVCVDQLAASGGYLMACCADEIICSPWAAVGSIGVISQQPNVAQRLEREGLRFIQTTAGKWKTTVTPFSLPTPEQLAKVEEDLGLVYQQFATWVKARRPHVDIEQVATGEVWYGPLALQRGLVDRLETSAAYLLDLIEAQGCQIFTISCSPQKAGGLASVLGTVSEAIELAEDLELADAAASLLGTGGEEAAKMFGLKDSVSALAAANAVRSAAEMARQGLRRAELGPVDLATALTQAASQSTEAAGGVLRAAALQGQSLAKEGQPRAAWPAESQPWLL